MEIENNQNTNEVVDGGNDVELSPVEALRQGKLDFRTLPYSEKMKVSKEVYNSITDERQKEAWEMGWRPKELFVGKYRDGTDKPFTDHEEFLKKLDEIAPARNERLRHVVQEKTALEKEVEMLREENRKTQAILKMREERNLAQEEAAIAREMQEAREAADVDKFAAAQERKAQIENDKLRLKQFEPQQQNPQQPRIAPETLEWVAQNDWFNTDGEMAEYARNQEQILQKTHAYLPLAERLEMITKSVTLAYPARFPAPKPNVPAVEGGKSSGTLTYTRKNQMTFSELPDHERMQADRLIRMGEFKDREDFMKGYNKIVNKK